MPTPKNPQIDKFLTKLANGDSREEAANEMRCVLPPIGCGKPIRGFRDDLSAKEYRISGLCQQCQDAFYE
jgi:hypothetical protein